MPGTFEGFGLTLLYPDNWTLLPREDDEGDQGLTFDIPGGGFLSLETLPITREDESVIEEIDQTIREQYEDVERESVVLTGSDDDEVAVDWRFYYLDLVIQSRLVLLHAPASTREQMPIAGRMMMQYQAELSDFAEGEMVAAAILKQIRDAASAE